MITAICIGSIKDSNDKVIGYRVKDIYGNRKDIKIAPLIKEIRSGNLVVAGLRIVGNSLVFEEDEIKRQIIKLKLLNGLGVIPTYCGNQCYLIHYSNDNHTIYIPDNVTELNGAWYSDYKRMEFTSAIYQITGNIKVVGGHNLINANEMFYGCKASSLDLSCFDTSKVRTMENMFWYTKAKKINLSTFDTHNIRDMSGLFMCCAADELDLSTFDTSNVTDMRFMFLGCAAKRINISSFDTSKVKDMMGMFSDCDVEQLDLSNFDTSSIQNMLKMFFKSNIDIISSDPRILEEAARET